MFLGLTFATGINSFSMTAIPNFDSSILSIQNAVFDELYVSTNPVLDFDGTIPQLWDFGTVLHAMFGGDLYGGNVNFTEELVEAILIKKRTNKDARFQTIFEKKINSNEDFAIEFIDYYEPVGTIEYAYVPIISGGENNYIISSVNSQFDSYFIAEKGISYPLVLDVAPTETVVYQTGIVKPLGRRFPISIVNGNTGYRSGKIQCMFVEVSDNGETDVFNATEYRERIYQLLTDGRPKILKDHNGNLRMVNIDGDITESTHTAFFYNSHSFTHVTSTFNWIECGDAYNVKELYTNNFIDTSLG